MIFFLSYSSIKGHNDSPVDLLELIPEAVPPQTVFCLPHRSQSFLKSEISRRSEETKHNSRQYVQSSGRANDENYTATL